jgi:hypothetical protein
MKQAGHSKTGGGPAALAGGNQNAGAKFGSLCRSHDAGVQLPGLLTSSHAMNTRIRQKFPKKFRRGISKMVGRGESKARDEV